MVSLAALVIASDWFISSAEKIGTYIGIPSFVIGVTIVAFGTSLPELATSIAAVTSGTSEIVIGNVIGSNITNILLVLGLAAFLGGKMKIDFDVMDIDMPLLFGSAFLLYFALYDLQFTLIEATIFIIALIVFLLNSFTRKKVNDKDKKDLAQEEQITFTEYLVKRLIYANIRDKIIKIFVKFIKSYFTAICKYIKF